MQDAKEDLIAHNVDMQSVNVLDGDGLADHKDVPEDVLAYLKETLSHQEVRSWSGWKGFQRYMNLSTPRLHPSIAGNFRLASDILCCGVEPIVHIYRRACGEVCGQR